MGLSSIGRALSRNAEVTSSNPVEALKIWEIYLALDHMYSFHLFVTSKPYWIHKQFEKVDDVMWQNTNFVARLSGVSEFVFVKISNDFHLKS